MSRKWFGIVALLLAAGLFAGASFRPADVSASEIARSFGRQGIRISRDEAEEIRRDVRDALRVAAEHGFGNSKVDFAAVEIAQALDLDVSRGSNTVRNIVAALRDLADDEGAPPPGPRNPPPPVNPPQDWLDYYDSTLNLWNQPDFLRLVSSKGFHPVKISWEDIGRDEGSAFGDRISDVGIWVRSRESDPRSARLALSVRRSDNFTDRVLMVPSEKIRIHQRVGRRTVEKSLPDRLRELGLSSRRKDRNVIVSNQFAIVPVPERSMRGAWPRGVPPRAAFNFSIFPYGSTNLVITDVIEGSHEAVVGPGSHQLLFANVGGERAPFTASRAEDRQDLLRLERELRAKGMDVDVQRYYLIQVPLRRDARGVRLSNMGTPPGGPTSQPGAYSPGVTGYDDDSAGAVGESFEFSPSTKSSPAPAPSAKPQVSADQGSSGKRRQEPGLDRVAIGHGEEEGPYYAGDGWRGARAEEPVRVTVVYFVTPVGRISRADMENFSAAFEQWDSQAIWGGSFVTKETN